MKSPSSRSFSFVAFCSALGAAGSSVAKANRPRISARAERRIMGLLVGCGSGDVGCRCGLDERGGRMVPRLGQVESTMSRSGSKEKDREGAPPGEEPVRHPLEKPR